MRATCASMRVRAPLHPGISPVSHSRNFRHSRHSRERTSAFGRTLRHRNASDRAGLNDSNHHRERLESVLAVRQVSILFSPSGRRGQRKRNLSISRGVLVAPLSRRPFTLALLACIDSKWIRNCDRRMESCRLDGFRSTLLCPEDFPSPGNRRVSFLRFSSTFHSRFPQAVSILNGLAESARMQPRQRVRDISSAARGAEDDPARVISRRIIISGSHRDAFDREASLI